MSGFIKFLMIGINIIFWAIGGTMLGIGIWLAVDPNALQSFNVAGMDDDLWAAAVYTMIAVGALVFLIGFLGCFGAMKADGDKSNIMLWLYIGFVILILVLEGVIITLAAIFWTSIDGDVLTKMQDDVVTVGEDGIFDDDDTSEAWNNMQRRWDCCGANDYRDYRGNDNFNRPADNPVPRTCCTKRVSGDDIVPTEHLEQCYQEARSSIYPRETDYLNSKGCYKSLVEFVDRNAAIIIGVTCGFIGLQILGVIFACCLMRDDFSV